MGLLFCINIVKRVNDHYMEKVMTLESDIRSLSKRLNLDWELIYSVAILETNGNIYAHRFDPKTFFKISKQTVAFYHQATKIDQRQADYASAWGAFQTMGMYAEDLGYQDSIDMANQLNGSSYGQVDCFERYISQYRPNCLIALRDHDFEEFGRIYKGENSNYRKYAEDLQKAFEALGKRRMVILQVGSEGAAVSYLQKLLNIKSDGIYGPQTRRTVEKYQRENDLVVTGKVGKLTWEKLEVNSDVAELPKVGEIISTLSKKRNWLMSLFGIGGVGGLGEALKMYGPYGLIAIGAILILIYFYMEIMNGKTKDINEKRGRSNDRNSNQQRSAGWDRPIQDPAVGYREPEEPRISHDDKISVGNDGRRDRNTTIREEPSEDSGTTVEFIR